MSITLGRVLVVNINPVVALAAIASAAFYAVRKLDYPRYPEPSWVEDDDDKPAA